MMIPSRETLERLQNRCEFGTRPLAIVERLGAQSLLRSSVSLCQACVARTSAVSISRRGSLGMIVYTLAWILEQK